jgi:hypothetical protein
MSIEKIKIVIKTAIPGKEPFELKRDVLYIPDSQDKAVPSSEYPFITSTRLFNKSELQNYAYTYGYSKIVYYFFDKITFERFFTLYTIADDVETITNKPKKIQKIKENLIANINIMLELLFPMTYPATKDTFAIVDDFRIIDFNNDGFVDIVNFRSCWRGVGYYIQFLKNNGNRTFTEVTEAYIDNYKYNAPNANQFIWLVWIRFVDINNDGMLDLIGREQMGNEQTIKWINTGNFKLKQ